MESSSAMRAALDAAESSAQAWAVVFAKSRVVRRDVPLGFDPTNTRLRTTTGRRLSRSLRVEGVGGAADTVGLRWRYEGDAVLFQMDRVLNAPRRRPDRPRRHRVGHPHHERLHRRPEPDRVRDKQGRVLRQAERNLYLRSRTGSRSPAARSSTCASSRSSATPTTHNGSPGARCSARTAGGVRRRHRHVRAPRRQPDPGDRSWPAAVHPAALLGRGRAVAGPGREGQTWWRSPTGATSRRPWTTSRPAMKAAEFRTGREHEPADDEPLEERLEQSWTVVRNLMPDETVGDVGPPLPGSGGRRSRRRRRSGFPPLRTRREVSSVRISVTGANGLLGAHVVRSAGHCRA